MLESDIIESTSSWPFVEIRKLIKERKDLIKARDQGGVIAVEADGILVTAYRLESFNRKLAKS